MTDVIAADLRRAESMAKRLAGVFRGMVRTIAVYLAVALLSGASYALTAAALNGGTIIRFWVASLLPIAAFLTGRSLLLVYRRRRIVDTQLDLFGPR